MLGSANEIGAIAGRPPPHWCCLCARPIGLLLRTTRVQEVVVVRLVGLVADMTEMTLQQRLGRLVPRYALQYAPVYRLGLLLDIKQPVGAPKRLYIKEGKRKQLRPEIEKTETVS